AWVQSARSPVHRAIRKLTLPMARLFVQPKGDSMTLSFRLLPALIAAALCTAAASASAASTTWVSTHTRAHDVFSAETGDALAAAEEVAPGHALHVVVTLQLRNRDALDQRVARIMAGSR